MLKAFIAEQKVLIKIDTDTTSLATAQWIDLMQPTDEQIADVAALGIDVPTLADMEEIEISNRLYREDTVEYMTVVVPGLGPDGVQILGPVTFILTPERLVTVRHHRVRPFETYPARAKQFPAGCTTAERIFLGLIGEIVARQADLLEGIGTALDTVSVNKLNGTPSTGLQIALADVGRQGRNTGPDPVVVADGGAGIVVLRSGVGRPAARQGTAQCHKGPDARHRIIGGPRRFPEQSRIAGGRFDTGHDQPCAKQHRTHRFRGGGPIPAPDVDRIRLRHEFQPHARIIVDVGLSHRDRGNGFVRRRYVVVLQMEELVVISVQESSCRD